MSYDPHGEMSFLEYCSEQASLRAKQSLEDFLSEHRSHIDAYFELIELRAHEASRLKAAAEAERTEQKLRDEIDNLRAQLRCSRSIFIRIPLPKFLFRRKP